MPVDPDDTPFWRVLRTAFDPGDSDEAHVRGSRDALSAYQGSIASVLRVCAEYLDMMDGSVGQVDRERKRHQG